MSKPLKAVTLISMILNNKYTMPYIVPTSAIDGLYRCTPLSFAALSQDLAANHYSSTGIFMPQLQKNGKIWIISKQHFEIYEYPLWLDSLILQTWAQPPKGFFCFRDFAYYYAKNGKKPSFAAAFHDFESTEQRSKDWDAEALQEQDSLCVRGSTCWMALNTETNQPAPLDEAVFGSLAFCSEHLEGRVFAKIGVPETWDRELVLQPSLLDIDMNGHVNNLNYIRWALSAMDASFCRGKLPRILDTNFLISAQYGQELCCRSAYSGDGTVCTHSIVRTSDGAEVFRARTEWADEAALARPLCIE